MRTAVNGSRPPPPPGAPVSILCRILCVAQKTHSNPCLELGMSAFIGGLPNSRGLIAGGMWTFPVLSIRDKLWTPDGDSLSLSQGGESACGLCQWYFLGSKILSRRYFFRGHPNARYFLWMLTYSRYFFREFKYFLGGHH